MSHYNNWTQEKKEIYVPAFRKYVIDTINDLWTSVTREHSYTRTLFAKLRTGGLYPAAQKTWVRPLGFEEIPRFNARVTILLADVRDPIRCIEFRRLGQLPAPDIRFRQPVIDYLRNLDKLEEAASFIADDGQSLRKEPGLSEEVLKARMRECFVPEDVINERMSNRDLSKGSLDGQINELYQCISGICYENFMRTRDDPESEDSRARKFSEERIEVTFVLEITNESLESLERNIEQKLTTSAVLSNCGENHSSSGDSVEEIPDSELIRY